MRQQSPRSRRSPVAQMLSTILFVAAIGFAGAAIYLWYTGDDNDGPEPPPAAEPGDAELANVVAVLQSDEPDWDYGRTNTTARSSQFSQPGQLLTLGDVNLYVFIFAGNTPEDRIAAREEAVASADPAGMELKTPSGEPIGEGQTLHMAHNSNVITILVGGDQALADQVEESIAALQ